MDEAIATFKGVIDLDPRNANAHFRLDQLYTQLGRQEEALAIRQKWNPELVKPEEKR
jgi:lipopolysaccharide biosynthesis regulator YciM